MCTCNCCDEIMLNTNVCTLAETYMQESRKMKFIGGAQPSIMMMLEPTIAIKF